jgi:hypothetical protein
MLREEASLLLGLLGIPASWPMHGDLPERGFAKGLAGFLGGRMICWHCQRESFLSCKHHLHCTAFDTRQNQPRLHIRVLAWSVFFGCRAISLLLHKLIPTLFMSVPTSSSLVSPSLLNFTCTDARWQFGNNVGLIALLQWMLQYVLEGGPHVQGLMPHSFQQTFKSEVWRVNTGSTPELRIQIFRVLSWFLPQLMIA